MSFVDTARLPLDVRTMVEAELQSGERITWLDQPMPGRLARSTWGIVLFGIPWTAFALFWTGTAGWMTSKAEGIGAFKAFPLFGVPFIIIGLGMLSAPYWARRSAKRTAYVITDRRAIIFKAGLRSINVRSFEPEALQELHRNQQRDGSGDLIFSKDWRRDSDGDRQSTDVGFMAIQDVKAVEELVRALAQRKLV